MKNLVILGLVAVILMPLLMAGCAEKAITSPVPIILKDQTLTLSQDEFSANASITQYIEMVNGGTLTVRLYSNPSTGYSWGDAEITHASVIEQLSRNFEEPTTNALGAPGTEVWVFHAIDTGLAIIKISYGRPWESEKLYNLTININVR